MPASVEGETPPDRLAAGRRRVVGVTAAVAATSLIVGMVTAGRITSPQEAASRTRPPEAADITAEVELRVVRSEVVTRGDVVYEGAVDVALAAGGLDTSPVVTGLLPRVGDPVVAGSVLLQVVGRPLIVLPGDVPAYRDLRPGLAGPDVVQLEAALLALGFDPGNATDGQYDQQTAAAVVQLYGSVGYTPPPADETLAEELDAAGQDETAAVEAELSAQQALAAAGVEPPASQRLEAEALVTAAERMLAEAQASGDPVAVADAQSQLAIAQAQRDEMLAPADTTFEQAALAQAQARLAVVRVELADLTARAATPLPAAEVAFLAGLPRRVDAVFATRGAAIDGAAVRVSGADLVVLAALTTTDADLVQADLAVQLDVGGDVMDGTVVQVRDAALPEATAAGGGDGGDGGDGGQGQTRRQEAVVRPAALTAEQVEALRGENVRVTIPVQSTSGPVLAVPLAALSAGPGGESRVQTQRADGTVELVEVTVGLSAGGFAEVCPVDGSLEEGDRVVVGR